MRNFSLFILFSLVQSICLGQLNNEVFFNYSSENSRFPAGNIIENFSEQENGIIWMGSRNGLYRFDGIEFKNFNKNIFDSASSLANYISCQYLEGNQLYAGTYSAGFFVLDVKTLKAKQIFLLDSSVKNNFTVRFIYADKGDSLWIGTNKEAIVKMHKTNFGKRAFKLNSKTNETKKEVPNFKKLIPALHKSEHYWALEENSVWLINKSTGENKKYFSSGLNNSTLITNPLEFTDMLLASDSIAWLTSFNSGIYKWNFIRDEIELFYPTELNQLQKNIGFNAIASKSDEKIFISSSGFGLLVFNVQSKTFQNYEAEPGKKLGIPSGGSRALFKDKKGGIWLSFLNAVSYWHPEYQQVKKISLPASFKNTRVQQLQAIDNNNLFASLENNKGSLLYNEEDKNWRTLPAFVNEKGTPEIATVFYTSKINNNWVYKPSGLAFYSLLSDFSKFIPYQENLSSSGIISTYKINGIAATPKKLILTGKDDVIVFDKENNNWQIHKISDHPDSLHVKGFQNPVADKFGNVWMGSQAGLSVYDPDKNTFKEISYRTKNEFEGLQFITDLQLNQEGTLVFAATKENGIFVFNTKNKELVAHYNTENLLTQNNIYHIALSNADSVLWAAAYQSITKININNNYSETYDDKNSLLDLKLGFFSFTATTEGHIYAADTILYKFTSKEKLKNVLLPFISSYRLKNDWYAGNTEVYLSKENSFVELLVGTGNYADKAHEKIYFSVDGEKDWNEAENGKIILTSLNNGSTSLSIKVINSGINYGEGIVTITIKREKYFYQTWWFATSLLLAIAAMLLYIFKRKIKIVRDREREKALNEIKLSEFEMASLRSQMNPHFLFNSLSSLRYLVMTSETKKATKFIIKLSKLLRNILNHSQQKTILLQDELEALELYLEIESLRFENGFTYTINVEEIDNLFQIEIPPLLLQPIVENAIKHGLVNSELTEKWVQINVQQLKDEAIEITISDNGIGREHAAKLKKYNASNSLGNSLTVQRMVLFNKTHAAQLSCSVTDLSRNKINPGTQVKIIYKS